MQPEHETWRERLSFWWWCIDKEWLGQFLVFVALFVLPLLAFVAWLVDTGHLWGLALLGFLVLWFFMGAL